MTQACVLCAARNPSRDRQLEHGHVCQPCRNGLRTDLGQILDLVAIAATMPDPLAARANAQSSRPHPGSRPPLEVARLDPERILIRVEPSDPSADTALLVLLEDWCRLIREERGFAPYGIATEDQPRSATLTGAIAFLRAQVDYCCDEPTFSLEQFAGNIRRAVGTLKALDPEHARRGWGIPCPADIVTEPECNDCARTRIGLPANWTPEVHAAWHEANPTTVSPCKRVLRVARHEDDSLDLHSDIYCPNCGTTWTAQRLLLVALADNRVTIWGYPSEISEALAIPARTLRDWAAKGRIERQGNRYDAGAAFRLRHMAREQDGA